MRAVSEKPRTRLLRAPRRIRSYLAANAGGPVLLLAASEGGAGRDAGGGGGGGDRAGGRAPPAGPAAAGRGGRPSAPRAGQRSLQTVPWCICPPAASLSGTCSSRR